MQFVPHLFLVLMLGCSSQRNDVDVSGNWGPGNGSAGPGHGHHHDHEVITTVILNFEADDGDDVSATARSTHTGDLIIDDINLTDGTNYVLTFEILNEEETPPEEIHLEIADEDDDHQIFFQGSAVVGPATGDNEDALVQQYYADADENGLPIGLVNDILTLQPGVGELTVTLRHMPLQDGERTKTAGAAEEVAMNGLSAIGGDNDFSIDFDLTVE